MKITKLVILFNKNKIIFGIVVSIISIVASYFVPPIFSKVLIVLGVLIIVNIMMSLYASYKLYDKSALYKPEELLSEIEFKKDDKVLFLHASFDPISRKLENYIGIKDLKVYNLYGNRHEHEKSIEISNREFPPHPNQINVDPTNFIDKSNTIDYVLAITSAHEILSQEKRIKFFAETKRILKNGGTLILCEQMRNLTNFIFFNVGAFHFVTLKDWKKAIKKSNMKIVKEEKLTMWGTIMYIKKE